MTDAKQISISSKAYYKMMLHCMKHTSSDCFGFLIGNKENNSYTISDAVPLTHDKIFAPSLEVAVKMISMYMSNEGSIVGLYENLMCNQMKSDSMISPTGSYICELISKMTKNMPVLLEVSSKDNTKDKVIEDEIFVKEYVYNDKGGFDYVEDRKESEEEYKEIGRYLKGFYQNDIVDFDEHLLNSNLDWRNTFIK